MTDREFLNWIADRLVHQNEDEENVDFILRLRDMANRPVLTAGKILIVDDPSKCIQITNEFLAEHIVYQVEVRGTTGIMKTMHLLVHKDKISNMISTIAVRCLADAQLKGFMCIESMERINSILVE